MDEFSDNSLQIQSNNNFQSPFSRSHKFKNNKNIIQSPAKKVRISNSEIINEQMNKSEEESPAEKKDLLVSKKPTKKIETREKWS